MAVHVPQPAPRRRHHHRARSRRGRRLCQHRALPAANSPCSRTPPSKPCSRARAACRARSTASRAVRRRPRQGKDRQRRPPPARPRSAMRLPDASPDRAGGPAAPGAVFLLNAAPHKGRGDTIGQAEAGRHVVADRINVRLKGIARYGAGARFETLDIAVMTSHLSQISVGHRGGVGPRLVVLDGPPARGRERRRGRPRLPARTSFETGTVGPPCPQERRRAMRGSSELHAWGDSNLYLRRRDRQSS